MAIKIVYEVLNNLTDWYARGKLHGTYFTVQFKFTGLNMVDRKKIELPLSYEDDKGKWIDYTDKDTQDVVSHSQSVPYYIDEAAVKAVVINRVEAMKKEYLDKLNTPVDTSRTVAPDSVFVEKF